MNVIDLRDELYKRRIDIIEITDECVYYAEELDESGEQRVYIYSYAFSEERERALSFFTLDDRDCMEHFYSCSGSIIAVFENGGSEAWVVNIDKKTGAELLRKKISLIGRYFDCVPISDNDLVIYTKPDDEHKELFNRCMETTNSDTLANLYDLKKGYRYFVKDFKTAALIENGMHGFVTASGEEKLLLCDPYCGEQEKEELVKALSAHLSELSDELRDNIWVISKKRLIEAIKSGEKKIALRRAASAGLEGTVRFECVGGKGIIFRAKVYASKLEQFFEMSPSNGKISPVCTTRKRGEGSDYYTDSDTGRIYYLTWLDDGSVRLEGEVGSKAEITYPERVGEIVSCIDDRYIIADRSFPDRCTAIYDSRLNITDTFEARAKINGSTVVLY